MTLHNYIMRVYCREHEEDTGKNEAYFRLPDPSIMSQAAQTSLDEISTELTNLQRGIKLHSKQVR